MMSSLNAATAPPAGDPLYDSHASIHPELPRQADSRATGVYGEEMERLHDLFLSNPAQFYQIVRFVDCLFDSGRDERNIDRFCDNLLREVHLDGISFFLTRSNTECYEIVRVLALREA